MHTYIARQTVNHYLPAASDSHCLRSRDSQRAHQTPRAALRRRGSINSALLHDESVLCTVSTFCGGHFPGLAIISCCSRVLHSPPPPLPPQGITGKFQNPFANPPRSEIANESGPQRTELRENARLRGTQGTAASCHRGYLLYTVHRTWYCRYGRYVRNVHVGRFGGSQPAPCRRGWPYTNRLRQGRCRLPESALRDLGICMYVCVNVHTLHTRHHTVW